MNMLVNIARWVVGLLFIFSGLVKANDPLGLSYKMQEFFEVWNWHFLNDYTLAFSVIMIVFEIVAGVAVILGWKMNLFSWLLLLLIVFFTFLTGYALFSGQIRECGCFGDCIPLQARQSFIKDLVLLALILLIMPYRKRIAPLVKPRTAVILLFFSTIFSFALQWYVLQHLPLLDCLPYKVGNNIPEKMRPPEGSIPDSTVIMFTYEKNGQRYSFSAEEFPGDFDDSYVFVSREDKVVRKGTAIPAIRDFSFQTESGNDTTLALLTERGYKLFLFVKDGYVRGKWEDMADLVRARAAEQDIDMYLVTNLEKIPVMPELTRLHTDGTAIKTAARYNPTLFLIREGTIIGKWSGVDLERALTAIDRTAR